MSRGDLGETPSGVRGDIFLGLLDTNGRNGLGLFERFDAAFPVFWGFDPSLALFSDIFSQTFYFKFKKSKFLNKKLF